MPQESSSCHCQHAHGIWVVAVLAPITDNFSLDVVDPPHVIGDTVVNVELTEVSEVFGISAQPRTSLVDGAQVEVGKRKEILVGARDAVKASAKGTILAGSPSNDLKRICSLVLHSYISSLPIAIKPECPAEGCC